MVKRILKFFGIGTLGSIIVIAIFSENILKFFETNEYLNNVLYLKFGKGTTIILGLILLFIMSYIALALIIKIIKLIYKLNEKYHFVVGYRWYDFLASFGIFAMFGMLYEIISSFEANEVLPTIGMTILGVWGIINYKNRIALIKQYGYTGFSLFFRLITTFLFGLASFGFFIFGLIFHTAKATPDILDVATSLGGDGEMEYGYMSDGNGNITPYSNYKQKDANGNVRRENIHFKDDDGKDHDISINKF